MRRPRGYYDPRFDDPYAYRGWGRPRYPAGNSCLRDACLLETGCCVAEALDGNCLIAALFLLPQFVGATTAAMLAAGRRADSAGRRADSAGRRADATGRRADHAADGRSSRLATGRGSSRLAAGLVGAIRVYQREISAHRRPCCRFTPSCSEYAVEALQTHGARGVGLAARRLLRCRPGGARGADPVPAVV